MSRPSVSEMVQNIWFLLVKPEVHTISSIWTRAVFIFLSLDLDLDLCEPGSLTGHTAAACKDLVEELDVFTRW